MRPIAISNLAWPAELDTEALAWVAKLGLQGVELAPAKALGGWEAMTFARAADYRSRLADLGLVVPALQAITFGISGARLFGAAAEQQRLAQHLGFVARLGRTMGVRACVFGSPGLRDPGELSAEAAFDQAVAFFRALGSVFAGENVILGIEPNSALYGCRFVVQTNEAIALAAAIDHPNIRIHFDVGTAIANEDSDDTIERALTWTTHVHASEIGLVPLGTSAFDHKRISRLMDAGGYNGWVSIEMREKEPWLESIEAAAAFARTIYA
jgi:D-psicose/D-tagatose/L-ribulose 3-epimerase